MKMKIKTLFLLSFIFILSSCFKDEMNNETSQETTSEELVSTTISISDIYGKNNSTATVELFAKNQNILDSYLSIKSFKIEPFFDDIPDAQTDNNTYAPEKYVNSEENSENQVSIVIRDLKLEEGATGFKFHVEHPETSNKTLEYDYSDWHPGPKWWHYGMFCMETTQQIRYDWYNKKGSLSFWKWAAGGIQNDWGCIIHQHGDRKIKLRVQSYSRNYSVFYKHWWEDEWVPCWQGDCN